MVTPDQFIDRTFGRKGTFFDGRHRGPRGLRASDLHARSTDLGEACRRAGAVVHEGGTYVCMEGPQFSTLAESNLYRSWGADLIGMTNLQEAKLAREAEICYATLAMVTDYDCWHPGHDAVTVDQVVAVVQKNASMAKAILKAAVEQFPAASRLRVRERPQVRDHDRAPPHPREGQKGPGAHNRALLEIGFAPRRPGARDSSSQTPFLTLDKHPRSHVCSRCRKRRVRHA